MGMGGSDRSSSPRWQNADGGLQLTLVRPILNGSTTITLQNRQRRSLAATGSLSATRPQGTLWNHVRLGSRSVQLASLSSDDRSSVYRWLGPTWPRYPTVLANSFIGEGRTADGQRATAAAFIRPIILLFGWTAWTAWTDLAKSMISRVHSPLSGLTGWTDSSPVQIRDRTSNPTKLKLSRSMFTRFKISTFAKA
jgi:hypothetical protein